jgi:hypothetical protein
VPPRGPYKLNEELQTRVCNALRFGIDVETACRVEGIAQDTYYEWRKRGMAGEEPYKAFYDATEEAYLRVELALTGSLLKAAASNWQAALSTLKWRKTGGRTQVELTGKDGAPLQGALTQESADLIRNKILFGETKTKKPEPEGEGEP